jgi:hypothetical protein
MVDSIPIVIIAIGVVLVVIGLLAWRWRGRLREGILEGISNKRKKAFFTQWIIGLVIVVVAAVFMFDGDILGENTSGISRVMGIVGICLIATSSVNLLSFKPK